MSQSHFEPLLSTSAPIVIAPGGTYSSNIIDVTNFTTISLHVASSSAGVFTYQLVLNWYFQDDISGVIPDATQVFNLQPLGLANNTFSVKAKYFSYELNFAAAPDPTTVQVNSFLLTSSGEIYHLTNVGSGVEILKPQLSQLRTVTSSDGSVALTENANEIDVRVAAPFSLTNVGGGAEAYIPLNDEMRTFVATDASMNVVQNAQTIGFQSVTDYPTNVGPGAQIYIPLPSNQLRTLTNTDGQITITQGPTSITINSAGGGGGTTNPYSANLSFENYAAPTVVNIPAINTLVAVPTVFTINEVTAGAWADAGSGEIEYNESTTFDFLVTASLSGLAAGIGGPAYRFHLQTRVPPGAWSNVQGASTQTQFETNTRRSCTLTGLVRLAQGEQIRIGVINTQSTDNISIYVNSISIVGPSAT